ncbi:MAG: nuclear transport factor 2 family protein [Pleurocapsa sp. SU_5_0]|nr:nuclear transport factor 2 family protein [Pleurocapsa sp. SU_5_0]NJO96261.1 nuclear transport factor 2 family protein [Pleurocapsa sp. CRU_1_2]
MNHSLKIQIIEAEERLRLAILSSDVNILDELLAPELIFTNHLGQVLGKQDDLDAHQSGTLRVEVLTPFEQHIQLVADVAIVTVRVHLVGRYAGITSDCDFRFTRVWTLSSSGTWQIIVAHSSIVV